MKGISLRHKVGIKLSNQHSDRRHRINSKRSTNSAIRLVVTISVLGSLIGTPGAAAEGGLTGEQIVSKVLASSNPKESYEQLSSSEKAAFDRRMLPKSVTVDRTVSPTGGNPDGEVGIQSGGCWRSEARGSARAAAGNTLYTYWVAGTWCISNGRVTSARVDYTGGETSTPGWRYEGERARGSGISSNIGRMWARHRFVLGSGGWDVQTTENCIRLNGYANHTAGSDLRCSIF